MNQNRATMPSDQQALFRQAFHGLERDSTQAVDAILTASFFRTAPAGAELKTEGEHCGEFVFLVSGEKRVYKRGPNGREITLYEMNPGDICVLNATSILSNTPLPANASSLTDVAMFLTPAAEFLRLLGEHGAFRHFVFSRINAGFLSITSLISEVVFSRVGERLNNYLVEKSEDGVLNTTHQRIADDLGTSREVISRLLKELERQGDVCLSRHFIQLNRLL